MSTVLFGLATVQLPGVFGTPTPVAFGVWVFGSTLAVLTWLVGLAGLLPAICAHRLSPTQGPARQAAVKPG